MQGSSDARSHRADTPGAHSVHLSAELDTLSGFIRQYATQTPKAVAIAAPGRPPLDYAALHRFIETVATTLRTAGIQRAHRVAIVMPNGPEMATALLAVACCATAVPINPELGSEEADAMIGAAKVGALLVDARTGMRAREVAHRRQLALIDASVDPREPAGTFALASQGALAGSLALGSADSMEGSLTLPSTQDIAFLLHTSGTTARPKRVPLSHAILCASARRIAATLHLSSSDRCLNVLPLFHIHGIVAALLGSLSAGGSIACTPGLAYGDFLAWLDELQPSWYTAVPTMHQAILDQVRMHRAAVGAGRLRFIRSSSARLSPPLATSLEACFDAPVISAYGMTEAAHQIASNPLPPGNRRLDSVGCVSEIELAIIDNDGRALPAGATGEITIRGPHLFEGYDDDADASRDAFTATGWFRTGDLGYLDADGYLYLVGRSKEVVNRGGEKFSLQEIDNALLEHAAVAQAAAFPLEHPTLGEDIVAAVILKNAASTSPEAIRTFLRGRLADFKVPARLLVVEALPTGATGKIDRARVRYELADALRASYVPPRSAIEVEIAAITSEVLGAAHLGTHDNFFAFGDSLQGTRVLARIHHRFGIQLALADLFNGPTIAQLARAVASALNAANNAVTDNIYSESLSRPAHEPMHARGAGRADMHAAGNSSPGALRSALASGSDRVVLWRCGGVLPMLLDDAEVHVWVIRLDTLSGVENDLTLLSAPEHDRAGRLRSHRDRSRFLRRRIALRTILGAYLGVEPRAIEYRLNRFGRPSLAPVPSGDHISFNTSHSNGVSAVAVARSLQIGIDIECLKPIAEAEAIAAHYFTANEMATLRALPSHQRIAGFYNGWTRKEAIVKALGGGLSIPLDCFEVSLKPGDPARILHCAREASRGQTLHLHRLELCNGYVAALASTAALRSIRLGVFEQACE